jgi:AcrR family transcriptional regulator
VRHGVGVQSQRPPLSPEEERRRLLDAARAVLARSGWSDLKVGSVLRFAGLSTRTFYRHFDSKASLLFVLYGDELASRLHARLPREGDPIDRVTAFIDAVIDASYDEDGPRASSRYFALHWREFVCERPDEAARVGWPLVQALQQVIQDGKAAGAFPAARPREDALAVLTLVTGVVGDHAMLTPVPPREYVRGVVLPFALAALTAPAASP